MSGHRAANLLSSRLIAIAAILVLLSSFLVPTGARAAPGDVGYEGPSFLGGPGAASGEKPESKLWFNDGQWWGSLWDASAGGYWIHRLNLATQTWVNTGTALDSRSSKADTLWHQPTGKLYVASHVYSSSGSSTSNGARLYRFSYNASTDAYTLDSGFPAAINGARSESLVIDRDSTGRLWATWVQDQTVYVNRTLCNPTCNDAAWGTPFVPAVNGVHPNSTSVDSDDISALIAFGTNKIGLMWSNQDHSAVYFAVHDDSAGDTSWQASRTAVQGPNESDDHINLATVLSDSGGRVYAAVKTSHSSGNAPLVRILVRDSAGAWTSHTHSTQQYEQTRPIVLVEEGANRLHVFASDEGGGGIYHKSAPLSNISFVDGKGTLVMWDDDVRDVNDATSTKQTVSSATGLVVLGSNNVTRRYWHSYDPLGGSPPPPSAPVANFSATPTSGTAPLAVSFTDTSTNTPTSWAWDFDGNGSTDSTVQHPQHTYTAAGTYTVSLTATNAAGSDSETKTGFITVTAPSGGGGTATFTPVADAKVSQSSPSKNYGTATDLRLRLTSSQSWRTFLKFELSGLGGSVTSATLRLFVTDASPSAGTVHSVSTTWTETGITWSNAPAIAGTPVASGGSATAGTWIEYDVTSAVTGNGTLSLGVLGTSNNSALFSSREGANPPQLVVTTSDGSPPPPSAPVANFSATPTSGTAPLAVSFTDTSTNTPTSWAWDFDGNGSTDSTVQHPQHTYTAAGTYTVSLTATNAAGSDSETKTGFITVTAPSGGGGTATFTPVADAKVSSDNAAKNYGTTTDLRIRTASTNSWNSYLRFDTAGLSGTVTSAKLRLFVTSGTSSGGGVYVVSDTWTETGVTWNNAPAIGGTPLDTLGPVSTGTWVEWDVTSAITGNGTFSLAIHNSGGSGLFSSREGANPPELVVTTSN